MEVNKKELLEAALKNDSKLDLEITDELLQICTVLGNQPPLFRAIYKTFLNRELVYENKPKFGARFSVKFDYEKQEAVLERAELRTIIPFAEFRRILGLIDSVYSEILPIGSVVELDLEVLPEPLQKMFKDSKIGAWISITGRKIPIREEYGNYVMGYVGYMWPFGQTTENHIFYLSNLMIQRVISKGLTMELEEEYAFEILRKSQLANERISVAFISVEEAKNLYDDLLPESVSV